MSKQILEGSRAVAEAVNLCKPDVICAYPITPQTHIVEDLAQFRADGKGNYEYVRAESEFAAASIVLGASATGARAYTATSSQGLLLMAEVVYNIAGMRLPVVMTCANRAVSAPINIWCDHSDAMAVRDAGWIMFFVENVQEAVDMHIIAFKIAETVKLPVMINMDGFILTHTYEPVEIPTAAMVKKFLSSGSFHSKCGGDSDGTRWQYKPEKGQYLDVKNPCTLGAFASPADYQGIREELQSDLAESGEVIEKVSADFYQYCRGNPLWLPQEIKKSGGLVEYIGDKNAEVVIVAMGSVVGTIRHTVQEMCSVGTTHNPSLRQASAKTADRRGRLLVRRGKTPTIYKGGRGGVGILKIKSFRPFPNEEIKKALKNAKYVAVLDKAISLGNEGILAGEIKQALYGTGIKVKSYVGGLGGRDVTVEMIKGIVRDLRGKGDGVRFV